MGRFRRDLGFERLEPRTLLAALPALSSAAGPAIEPAGLQSQLAAAVSVESVQGLRAAEVEIRFDAAKLQADAASVRAGAAWSGSGLAVAKVDNEVGTINAFVFSLREVVETSGSLIDIDFLVNESADATTEIELDLHHLAINDAGGAMETFVDQPAAGRSAAKLMATRPPSPELLPVPESRAAGTPTSQPERHGPQRPTPPSRLPLGSAGAEGERVELDAVPPTPNNRPSRIEPAVTHHARTSTAGDRPTAQLPQATSIAPAADRVTPPTLHTILPVLVAPITNSADNSAEQPAPAALGRYRTTVAAKPFGPAAPAINLHRPDAFFPPITQPAEAAEATNPNPPSQTDPPQTEASASRTLIAGWLSPISTQPHDKPRHVDHPQPEPARQSRPRVQQPKEFDLQFTVNRPLFAGVLIADDDDDREASSETDSLCRQW